VDLYSRVSTASFKVSSVPLDDSPRSYSLSLLSGRGESCTEKLVRVRLVGAFGEALLTLYSDRNPARLLFRSLVKASKKRSMNATPRTQALMVVVLARFMTRLA